MAKKPPSFRFYPDHWLGSERVALMTLEEEGAYIRLLCFCWRHGSIPSDPEKIARLIGKGGSTTLASKVSTMFQPDIHDPAILRHDRLDAERTQQEEWKLKSQAGGLKSAQKRGFQKNGSKGGYKGGSTTLATVVQPPLQAKCQPKGNITLTSTSTTTLLTESSSTSNKGGSTTLVTVVEPPLQAKCQLKGNITSTSTMESSSGRLVAVPPPAKSPDPASQRRLDPETQRLRDERKAADKKLEERKRQIRADIEAGRLAPFGGGRSGDVGVDDPGPSSDPGGNGDSVGG